jgi:hypothetical protein
VQGAIGKVVLDAVGPVHREGGLAHAAGAVDGRDHHRLSRPLLLDDRGGVRVTSGSGTRRWSDGEPALCISPNYHLELAHQMVSVSAGPLSRHAGYRGLWDIGVHATGLQGLKSTFAMNERTSYKYSTIPFQTEDYTSTTGASTDEMLDTPEAVVERLYSRFTRGMGLHGPLSLQHLRDDLREKSARSVAMARLRTLRPVVGASCGRGRRGLPDRRRGSRPRGQQAAPEVGTGAGGNSPPGW